MNDDNKNRVLQVNLDGVGGAFTLLFQVQKKVFPDYIFDYYWMGEFVKEKSYFEIIKLGGNVYEDNLRKNRFIGHILLPFYFYRFLKKNQYKIIHINADTAFKLLIYALPAKLAKCPCVIIHSHSSGINGNVKVLKKVLHYLCRPFLLRNSDIRLTCSQKASKWMFSNYYKSVSMIKNGIDVSKYEFSENMRNKYRNELGITDTQILLGTIGNLSYQKYPEYLIDILSELEQNYYLLFIGDGPNKQNIEKYVNKKGLQERVIFYGRTNYVNEILNAVDIFVMTSRFEGLPVSVVEAQANGLQCLLSDKITNEAKILNTCYFASIDEKVNKWIKIIHLMNRKVNRKEGALYVKKAGFDITDTACNLKLIYDKR